MGLPAWCETNRVDFVFGFARNCRLESMLAPYTERAHRQQAATGEQTKTD